MTLFYCLKRRSTIGGKKFSRRPAQPQGLRINRRIRARELMVIDSDGTQLGVMSVNEAMKVAIDQELDLVEVSPNTNPPVCKILDFGKYMYQQNKKHTKQKTTTLKEVKVRPQTSEHDLDFKIKNAKKFIEEGNKVKVSMMFRGREIVYASKFSKAVFDQICEALVDTANVETRAKMEGRRMLMILAPK
jgi:translation initiation factor IF-3